MTMPRLRQSSSLYKVELILGQEPWEDIDAARGRHRRVGPLVRTPPGPIPLSVCAPRRARSRLGTRHPPPGTTTTNQVVLRKHGEASARS